jgi:hypothetical protein
MSIVQEILCCFNEYRKKKKKKQKTIIIRINALLKKFF